MINYISNAAMPLMMLLIVVYGMKEKIKVYDTFLDGAKEGLEMVFRLLPTLVGIFVAVGVLKGSGILDLMVKVISPICASFDIPSQIMPLALIRPISGSASMAVAVDIMNSYGVDSLVRIDCFNYHGINRNNAIYHCYLYRMCRNKEDKIYIVSSFSGGFCRNCNINYYL